VQYAPQPNGGCQQNPRPNEKGAKRAENLPFSDFGAKIRAPWRDSITFGGCGGVHRVYGAYVD